jgi:prepilin-type N-terminal cleavage/methylation domain-containing protein
MRACSSSHGARGMTILEVLVALLILGFTTTAVVHLVVTGDRIAGRRSAVSYATVLAKNEAENLRTFERSPLLPNDTAYSDTVNGIEFDVVRTRVKAGLTAPDSVLYYQEFMLTVKRKTGIPLALSFRLLQGFYDVATP